MVAPGNDNGTPLPVPLSFPSPVGGTRARANTATVTLNPGSGQIVQADGQTSQAAQTGWAQSLANRRLLHGHRAGEYRSAGHGGSGGDLRRYRGDAVSTPIRLSAGGPASFLMRSQYALTACIRGIVEFDTPSDGQISVPGIRGESDGAFTTILQAGVEKLPDPEHLGAM